MYRNVLFDELSSDFESHFTSFVCYGIAVMLINFMNYIF